MANFRTSRTFDVIFVGALLIGLWQAYTHRTAITDAVFFWSYKPDAKTVQLATDAGLNDTGRHLLYRTNPQFVELTTMNAACDVERLGCLDESGTSYILDDPSKPNRTITTATHEMLHLAYRRLTDTKKAELGPLIDQAISQNSADITTELEDERSTEDRRDEAHSLLGTEYSQLPAELETYYQTYFSDRTKVIEAAIHEEE